MSDSKLSEKALTNLIDKVYAAAEARATALEAENARLHKALETLIAETDKCPRHETGAGGMTIDAQLRRTVINRVPAMAIEEAREVLGSLAALGSAKSESDLRTEPVATHRHKKRGTEYVLLGYGKMQAERWYDPKGSGPSFPIDGETVDMREVAIYCSVNDGSLWVRPKEEFNDGRFEKLPAVASEQEIPGKLEWYLGQLRPVVDASRSGHWRFHEHYDRNGYCDNPARGY